MTGLEAGRRGADDGYLSRRQLELAVTVVLILIFIASAARTIDQMRAAAEEAAVVRVIASLRGALALQTMRRAIDGDLGALARMDRANPMDYLEQPPVEFAVLDEVVPAEDLEPYRWYFSRPEGLLVYRIGSAPAAGDSLKPPACLRLQVRFSYHDADHDGQFRAGVDSPQGLDLVPLENYPWRGVKL